MIDGGLVDRLKSDIDAMHIPVETAYVDKAEFVDGRWHLFEKERLLCISRALLLASGLRGLSNEAEYFGKGLSLTYNGYDFLPEHLASLTAPKDVRETVVIGNEKTGNLLEIINAVRRQDLNITFLLDEPPSRELQTLFGESTVFGRVTEFRGKRHVEKVVAVDADERVVVLPCDMAFIDYAAFEVKPQKNIDIKGLYRDDRGFVCISRDGTTNLQGLFAAGDITGIFAMAVKALAEGSLAGFSAYRYVFRQKFQYDPPLFAYAAHDRPIDPTRCDYPELRRSDTLEVIGAPAIFWEIVESTVIGDLAKKKDRLSYDWLCEHLGERQARDLVFALLDAKVCTLQPTEETKREPASRT